MPENRPHPSQEQILPFLDYYRKVLYAPVSAVAIDRMPARGTTLKAALALGIGLSSAGCTPTELTYLYSHAANAGNDLLALYFVRPFTDAERLTPVLTKGGSRRYSWPAVLDKIRFNADWNFPLSAAYNDGTNAGTVTTARWFVDRWLRVGRPNYASAAEIKYYLSDTPSKMSRFVHPQPDPDEVVWDLHRHRGRVVALHGGVTVPARNNVFRTFASATVGSATALENKPQYFPPTEFRDWAPFVFETDEDFVDGLYVFTEVTIFPPPRRRPIVQSYSE